MSPSATARRRAFFLLGALGLLTAIELIAAAFAYRPRLTPATWDATASALAALPPDQPIVLADTWLAPSARAHLPALAPWQGLPDLHGAPRLHVLALGDPMTSALRDDLADLTLTPLGHLALGPLTLHHWALPGAGHVLWDILSDPALSARDARGPCRRAKQTWSCKQGRADIRFAEVSYRPRRCLALELDDGATLQLSARLELGSRLRGHLGFSDYNGRLRNDAPLLLELSLAGKTHARWTFTDSQGWAAFELPTTPGPAELTLRITSLLGGTFSPAGYDPAARRIPCLELRALSSPDP